VAKGARLAVLEAMKMEHVLTAGRDGVVAEVLVAEGDAGGGGRTADRAGGGGGRGMIRLHHVPQSRSMRTLWLLHELAVEFEVVEWPFDKTLRSPEYLALNPAGRVPALELDGRTIWETGAITEVLCERFPGDGHGARARRPRADRLADLGAFRRDAEPAYRHADPAAYRAREDHMRSPVLMQIEAKRAEKCYEAIAARLEGRDYLLDGGFSAADVSVGQAVYMARHFVRTEPFAALQDWYDRITARPGFIASLPVEDAGPALYAGLLRALGGDMNFRTKIRTGAKIRTNFRKIALAMTGSSRFSRSARATACRTRRA
jgi:glutathione S-transferase